MQSKSTIAFLRKYSMNIYDIEEAGESVANFPKADYMKEYFSVISSSESYFIRGRLASIFLSLMAILGIGSATVKEINSNSLAISLIILTTS